MRSAFALRINSGRIILNFGFQESLRTFLKPIFTGGVPTEKGCPPMVAPDKKTLKKSVKSMFFMVQTRCEVETIKY